jgi:hypothetical protein
MTGDDGAALYSSTKKGFKRSFTSTIDKEN